jgi:hypothetical protein
VELLVTRDWYVNRPHSCLPRVQKVKIASHIIAETLTRLNEAPASRSSNSLHARRLHVLLKSQTLWSNH